MGELTPAQKAAETRARNKAAQAAAADPFFDSAELQVPAVLDKVAAELSAAGNSDYVQVTASRVTPHIPANVRNIIYTVGIWAGVVGTVAPIVAAVLTGETATLVTSVGSLALALTNLLAKLNLSQTATDLARQ